MPRRDRPGPIHPPEPVWAKRPAGCRPTLALWGNAKFAVAAPGSAASTCRRIRFAAEHEPRVAVGPVSEYATSSVRARIRRPTDGDRGEGADIRHVHCEVVAGCSLHLQFCVEDARRVPGARVPLGPMPGKGRDFELRCCANCGARFERNEGNAGTSFVLAPHFIRPAV